MGSTNVAIGPGIAIACVSAVVLVADPTAAQALVAAMDQTRTVGLVTLPGAFVGMLLGGATRFRRARSSCSC